MNEEKSRMTLNISAQNRELIYQLVAKKTLGFNSLSTKEIFKYASALGLNKPSNLKNSDTYVRVDYLHTSDKALLITTKLGKAKTIAQIDEYCNIEHSYVEAEKCANTGFKILKEKVDAANGDEELLANRLLIELETLYQTNVKSTL
ncbi:MAG TPA: hypothetical protein PLE44_01890 [Bacilli bacterium]|jgi:hypothetical protein|nr:hypothetical protein [Bacilli bacterium]